MTNKPKWTPRQWKLASSQISPDTHISLVDPLGGRLHVPIAKVVATSDLCKALEAAVDSLEYVNEKHPEATGWGVRLEQINKARAALGRARGES